MLPSSIALASSSSFCWHYGPHCAGGAVLNVLALFTLLHWCCRCLRHGLPCCPQLSICHLNKGKDACKSTQCKHKEGKEACATRAIMPVHQGQQCQHDKGNNTSTTVQTRQVDRGSNTGAMMVTMPMWHESKEVSKIRTTTPEQQGQQHPCNLGDGASAMRVTTPL